jgi:FtsH-binding integral membrane protein
MTNFNLNWTRPRRLFANTPPEVIRVCRVTACVLGVMTAGLLFAIASFLWNRWLGIVALFALGRDRLLLGYFYRAMSEPILIFLICLFVLVCLWFYRKDRRTWGAPHHRLFALAAISLSIALSALAKPNGPLAGIAFAAVALVYYGFRAYARTHRFAAVP